MKAETNQFTSNNETFPISTYNGFSILIRDKDGFVNATKLVNDINDKELPTKELIALEKAILEENESAQIERTPLHYLLPNNFNNEVRGTYVYKELLTIICIKASAKYLRIVGKIMDSINEGRFELLNKVIRDLQTINAQLNNTNTNLNNTNEEQENIIFKTSVRTNISNKKLYILKINDDKYKISSNSTNKPRYGEIVNIYNFPALLNIPQDIKKHFNKSGRILPTFTEKELIPLRTYIMSLLPKDDE
jgi:uncharacterized membrane-anchored protein YhcB (DUF1043 family)